MYNHGVTAIAGKKTEGGRREKEGLRKRLTDESTEGVNDMSLKKLASLGLAFILLLSFIVPVSAATFRDTQGHWAQEAVENWNANGVVSGYDGAFRPNDAVTRAEFATMIDNMVKYVETGDNPFTDLSAEKWYYDALIKLNAAGVMNGSDGKALPDRPITRQEAAVIVAKAFGIEGGSADFAFTDADEIAGWAADAVNALVANKIVTGTPDGAFKPLANLTRAEAVTMFDNFVRKLIASPGEYSEDVQGNLVVNSADVVLSDMSISGDLYVTQGVGEGEVTLNNVEIAGDVFVSGGGENSIIFNSVDVKGALVVNKYNGKVRILATGSTSVSVTQLESGALLVTKELTGGGFETVEISADVVAGQQIVLDGNFNKVVNRSESAQITANGTIGELVAEASTKIAGNVAIDKVTAQNGATATVNDKTVENGGSVGAAAGGTVGGGSAGGGTVGGGSTGGGSAGGGTTDGGSGGEAPAVSVTGVSITESDISLVVGETKQLAAAVAPSNATNKNVEWQIAGDSTDVATIDQNGVLTAVGPGAAIVKVVTEDGGKFAQTTVKVSKPALGIALSEFAGDAVDAAAGLDAALVANSGSLSVYKFDKSLYASNRYDAMVVAGSELQQTQQPSGRAASLVVTLKDSNGNPLADSTGLKASVTSATYSYEAVLGEGLAEGAKPGSFVLTLDAGSPEAIRSVNVTVSHGHYADTELSLLYIPFGTAYVTGIDPVSGDTAIGSELAAGTVHFENIPTNESIAYKWLRADRAEGPYAVIDGAAGSSYTLTKEDSEKYIRVEASADQIAVGGYAVSEPFGPVQKAIHTSELFAAIEASFLGQNENAGNIVSNLNLMTALADFPGVTIAWESDNAAVTSEGIVTRDGENDQFVKLTVKLGGAVTDSKTYELIVRKQGTDSVETGDFIDPYFVDGYPQAYIKDGTIRVRYKLNAPAEVYMVVNAINGNWESSVKAVLEGRSGDDSHVVWVDEWPYFKIEAGQVGELQEFDTGVSFYDDEARVEFVIRDAGSNYTSGNVTTILFDAATVDALDTYPPHSYEAFVNDALDTIYLYYDEPLDPESKPAASEYALNYGSVAGVEVVNYENVRHMVSSYVKLTVSGIPADRKNDLELSYNGQSLQDRTDAKNKAETFADRAVLGTEEAIRTATISSDRKSVMLEIVPGWNPLDNPSLSEAAARFAVTVEGQGTYAPSSASYSYTTDRLWYALKFTDSLPAGAVSIKMDTTGIVGWAMNAYPAEITLQNVSEIGAPGTPTAAYVDGQIRLAFHEGFAFETSFTAAGLTLKVDGTEYSLRGFIVHDDYTDDADNAIVIDLNGPYAQHFKNAIESGSAIQIKYAKVNGTDEKQLSDAAGALVPDFDYVTVTK